MLGGNWEDPDIISIICGVGEEYCHELIPRSIYMLRLLIIEWTAIVKLCLLNFKDFFYMF